MDLRTNSIFHRTNQYLHIIAPLYRWGSSKILLLIFCGLVCFQTSRSQSFVHWHLVKNLNVANGLPQNTIRSMYFDDSSGFLWLATEGGLVRFDGVDAKSFTVQNVPQLKASRIYGLYTTTDHQVLAVDRTGGVMRIRGNDAVFQKGINLEWLNLLDKLVRNLHSAEGERRNLSSRIAHATLDFTNMVWINDSVCLTGSRTHIYLYNNKGMLVQDWLKPRAANTAFLLHDKKVYALNDDGSCFVIDLNQYKLLGIRADQIFRKKGIQLFQFADGPPLVLDGSKVYLIRFHEDKLEAAFLADLPDRPDHVISLIYDPVNEQIFCGTPNKGLFVYKKSPFYTYGFDEAHGDLGPYGTDQLSNIYACTLLNDSILMTANALLNLHTKRFSLVKSPRPLYYMTLASNDHHVYAWVGDTAGVLTELSVPDLKPERTFPAMKELRLVYTDKMGHVWFSGAMYLDRLDGDSVISYLDSSSFSQPIAAGIQFLFQSPHFLIGANGNGICKIDTIKRTYETLLSINRSIIRMPYVDKDDLCWIPTYGEGLYMYDLKANKLYKPSLENIKGLAYSHCIIDDGAGNFFISTNNGLIRVNRDGLIATFKNPKVPLLYQYFDVTNSLNANEFNGGCTPAYNKMPNGDILLPSLNGLVRLSPSLLTESTAYPVYLESTMTQDSLYSYSSATSFPLQFSSRERTLTLKFSFGQWDYSNFSGIYYRIDDAAEWSYLPPGDRKIQLTGLDGGDHRLEVKKQFDLAGKKVSQIAVGFSVEKTLFEKKITWILAGLCLLGFIWLMAYVVNLRLTMKNITLEEKVREKTVEVVAKNMDLEDALAKLNDAFERLERQGYFQRRLIALLNHDIMIPLKYISKVSSQLINYNQKLSPKSSEEAIEEINSTSIGLIYLGESIIQWIRLQEETFEVRVSTFELNRLLNDLLILHLHLAEEKGNKVEVDIPKVMTCQHDPGILRVILHNLLLNANKFTSDGVVKVRAFWKDKDIYMIISDTGTGMTPEKLARLNNLEPVNSKAGTAEEAGWGLGYRLILDMLRLCGGKIHIESERGKGTEVTIGLPPLDVEINK